MAEEFDPYYIWLGIPPKDQPPNHYRLLGLEVFEHNIEVIDAAANRQTSYLQDMASGPHRKQSQVLLNEIAAARRCLLDANRRAKYDAKLKAATASSASETTLPATEVPVAVAEKSEATPETAQTPASPTASADSKKQAPKVATKATTKATGKTKSKKKTDAAPKTATPGPVSADNAKPDNAEADNVKPENTEPGKAPTNDIKSDDANVSAGSQPLWKDWRILGGACVAVAAISFAAVMLMGDSSEPEASDEQSAIANINELPAVSLDDQKTAIDQPTEKTDINAGETDKTVATAKIPAVPKTGDQTKLVGHWTLDNAESNQSTVKDLLVARLVKFVGKPQFDLGPHGSAIVLNGKDDSISLDSELFKPEAGSLAFWIQLRTKSAFTPILATEEQPSRFTLQADSNGNLSSQIGEKESLKSTAKLDFQKWHHVVLTWVSDGPATIFIDGKQVAQHQNVGKLKVPSKPNIGLGAVGGKPVHAGIAIDDVRIFRGALSETKVKELLVGAKPPPPGIATAANTGPKPKAPAPKPKVPTKKTAKKTPAKKNNTKKTPKKPEPKPKPKKKPVPKDEYANARDKRGRIALHVNLGGRAVKDDKNDVTWLASKAFANKSWGHVGGSNKAEAAVPNQVQSTAVEGLSAFRATVPNGTYTVTLYFSENWINEPNKRVFGYQIESLPPRGIVVDLWRARGWRRPYEAKPFKIRVQDGVIDVNFKSPPKQQPPILNAIRILER